jgi:hypothetical protein
LARTEIARFSHFRSVADVDPAGEKDSLPLTLEQVFGDEHLAV